MTEQSYFEIGCEVAQYIADQKDMELRKSVIRDILDQFTNPDGTLAKRHNEWLENNIRIAENWKGMDTLPEDQVIGGAFVDAHRSLRRTHCMLMGSAAVEVGIDDWRYEFSDLSLKIREKLVEDEWRNQRHLSSSNYRDSETQIRLWVSNDIGRFRAALQSDLLGSGADPSRRTMLGFFEEWSAWNDNISRRRCILDNAKRHPECYLIFSTIKFAIQDMKHRLSIIEEAKADAENGIRAAVNQVYVDVIRAYQYYENPEEEGAADKVYAQEIAKHLLLP